MCRQLEASHNRNEGKAISDESDFARHCDYIHSNPVRHGLCQQAADWKYSSFHRYVVQGVYSVDWGIKEELTPIVKGWNR